MFGFGKKKSSQGKSDGKDLLENSPEKKGGDSPDRGKERPLDSPCSNIAKSKEAAAKGSPTHCAEQQRGENMTTTAAMSQELPGSPRPNSSSGKKFDELYKMKDILGSGAFSTVRDGRHSATNKQCAIKCVNRQKLSEEDAAALLDEVAILRELRHAHIICLYDFFDEPATYYLIMEQMTGGELFDRIVAKAYYNEKEARDTCKILLQAIAYCHANNVAHRDLKPENLLLRRPDSDSEVKIADFGFAKRCYTTKCLTTQCGTPGYVAPEILEGVPYDIRADMWSVGVILYILLGGTYVKPRIMGESRYLALNT